MGDTNIISAGSYIFAKDKIGKWYILAGKRSGNDPRFQGGLFNVPVGMREWGESIVQCAQRECGEETNLQLPINLFRLINTEVWGRFGETGANFIVILPSTIDNYQTGRGDGENEQFIWMPIESVNNYRWAYGMNNNIIKFYNQYIMKKIVIKESKLRNIVRGILKEMYGMDECGFGEDCGPEGCGIDECGFSEDCGPEGCSQEYGDDMSPEETQDWFNRSHDDMDDGPSHINEAGFALGEWLQEHPEEDPTEEIIKRCKEKYGDDYAEKDKFDLSPYINEARVRRLTRKALKKIQK